VEKKGRLFAGRPQHAVTLALLEPMRLYDLRSEDFLAIIDGMEMDARSDIRAPSLAEFDLCCARVAVAVGLLSVRIFGDATPAGERVAEEHVGKLVRLHVTARGAYRSVGRSWGLAARSQIQPLGGSLSPQRMKANRGASRRLELRGWCWNLLGGNGDLQRRVRIDAGRISGELAKLFRSRRKRPRHVAGHGPLVSPPRDCMAEQKRGFAPGRNMDRIVETFPAACNERAKHCSING
jgi:Squalene/phytoene synthase